MNMKKSLKHKDELISFCTQYFLFFHVFQIFRVIMSYLVVQEPNE